MSLPEEIYSVQSVRAIDRAAIGDAGISGYTLMTRAARAAYSYARGHFPDAKRWQIVCGAGNNAGDGYVLARLAAEDGLLVSVVAVVSPDALTDDAATAYGDFAGSGGVVLEWTGELDPEADLLVEGVFGSGLTRDVEGVFADVLRSINEHAAPVLALDIPGGIDGDSGRIRGVAVRAELTVTFVGLKTGLFLGDAPAHTGRLEFADLDIPESCRGLVRAEMLRIPESLAGTHLGRRPRAAHKGDFGSVLVVGGGPGMPGAIALCGEAALRCGAGRVYVATHPDHNAAIAAARPELMCHGLRTPAELDELLSRATVVVLGPGLGRSAWAEQMFDAVIGTNLPLVVDADALYWLAKLPRHRDNWILTPHPGEAAVLLATDNGTIQDDRLSALMAIHEKFGGVSILKGAGTLIKSGASVPGICTNGNPGMASPGMGDVLAGVIGALLAQGLPAGVAANLAVDIHARAGDRAALDGERGLLASDLMPQLRALVNP